VVEKRAPAVEGLPSHLVRVEATLSLDCQVVKVERRSLQPFMQDIQLFKNENWGYFTFLDPLTHGES
jgi:hypothetical protein